MLRRLATTAVATGLATAAAAGAVLSSPAAAGAGTTPKPTYVAIVLSGHGSACVKWKSGLTGDSILNAVATVHYRPSDHLIDQIDGTPSPAHADATHYWSYWHDLGSSWTYSVTGAGDATPLAGTVEGWSYVNGSSTATPPARAPKGLYAALCGRRDPAAAPPAPTVAAPGPTTAARTDGGSAGAPPVRRPGATEVPGVARPRGAAPAGRTSGSAAGGAAGASTGAAGTSGRAVPGAGTTASAAGVPVAAGTGNPAETSSAAGAAGAGAAGTGPVANAAAVSDAGSHGTLLPVLLAGAVVALLAGGAAVTARRRGGPASG